MNNGSASPEFFIIQGDYSSAISSGTVCTINAGGMLTNEITEGAPKYLALGNKAKSAVGKVRCMRIMDGMLFETEAHSSPESFKVGMRGMFSQNASNQNVGFSEGGEDMEIIQHHYTQNPDMIVVTIL